VTLTVGQLTYGGVTLGPGGIAQLVDIDGLTGLPTSRNGDVGRPNAAGMLSGSDFPGDRAITLDLEVTATGGNTMPQNLALLRQALQMTTVLGGGVNPPAGVVLGYNLGESYSGAGLNRQIAARVRKVDIPVNAGFAAGQYQYGVAKAAVLLDAVDPNIYDAVLQTASVGLTVATGGLTFPATFPATFGSQSGGLIYATNGGYSPCPPYMVITGPCTYPRIENQTTGVTLGFNTTLNTGDQLVVDCYAGSAVLNGTASRLNALAPASFINTFLLTPGLNTVGFYSSDATATGATLTLNWRNTWC
jgi:hypothetical protein